MEDEGTSTRDTVPSEVEPTKVSGADEKNDGDLDGARDSDETGELNIKYKL